MTAMISCGVPCRAGRAARAAAAVLVLAFTAGCTASGGSAGSAPSAAADGVRGTGSHWVNPDSPAARQVRLWERAGRSGDAALMRRIAARPVAEWPHAADPGPQVRRLTRAASARGRAALLVAYNVPHRDCGQHSAGGARDADAYRRWIGAFAHGIGDRRATVILEPDAVAQAVSGCVPARAAAQRYGLLADAVARLSRLPRTSVYLDAGNSGWVRDLPALAAALRRAGVGRADGFALNVSNFRTDAESVAYGLRLSRALGGAHFVVDTSRNGRGALPGGGDAWCNPPGRALGTPPTRRTGHPRVDAFLWVKRPGDSDGRCRGGPAAGRWWPEYALGLARRAR
jgi:endoglucanase